MNTSLLTKLLPLAACVALAACGAPSDGAVPAAAANEPARVATAQAAPASVVDEIAANLQACSYDGAPVKVPASGRGTPPADCRDMVARIMQFTGLPQNFDVIEAKVPNAAALVVLDEAKLPRRVIAFNDDFIAVVRRATGGNAWAPVSIMAHEIGHHLSGHTIMPGGSQPPTELEADKFSGFVLHKMGASLADAQQAMTSLVADGPDGATHPGRGKRLAAIAEGWTQACRQAGRTECTQGDAVARTSPPPMSPVATPAPSLPATTPATPLTAATPAAGPDVVPAPGSTPSKFGQFVYDEFGYFDRAERTRVEQTMFAFAQEPGIEVVTLLVRDLHGLSAQDYAHAMMRQLRVGKLDVGNGAVVVIAPVQRAAAIALGPGLMLENAYLVENQVKSLQRSIEYGWSICEKKRACAGWTENFLGVATSIAGSGKHWEWRIRYQNLADMIAVNAREFDERQASGASYDPNRSATWRKLVRFSGSVANLAPDKNDKRHFVNEKHAERVGPALLVREEGGGDAMLYLDPRTSALMPAGPLVEGRRYSFVARESNLHGAPPQLDLLSYDALP